MANVSTNNKLIDLLRRSKLVDDQKIDALLSKAAAEHGNAVLEDQGKIAEILVAGKLITRWQADKLLSGKHKGFRLGKYKLLDQIGKGGMSSVYLAEHELMKRQVAIKVLPKQRVSDASYLERFRLEARAVAKLDDPNIVRAYDIDNEGDIHYIVMEYVEGKDLHQIISQRGPLDYETAVDYVAQVANGLDHAHEMGMVHRDIKPANCLVDRHQTVKLLDLGLAKLTDDEGSLTLANEENVLGTADYLAPEQALNSHTADSRADIYSLGCTLYFLLTGKPPFPDGSISERLLKHQTATPDSIFKVRPDAPPSLVDICERMMAKKPEDRYQTAANVAKLLTSWLAERGRTLGGGHIEGSEPDSGIGSGIFTRFSVAPPTPQPGVTPASSETMSAADRDTARLTDDGSNTSALDENIGLAPIDEEDNVLSSKAKPSSSKKLNSPSSKLKISQPTPISASKSLVEEVMEESQREQDRITRMVQQRAQFNPLQPPGYTGSKGIGWILWVLLGVGAVIVLGLLALIISSSS
jgi:serine/threonine protein kinase